MTPTFDIGLYIVEIERKVECKKCQLVEQTPTLTESVPLSLAHIVSLSDRYRFDAVIRHDLQVYDVLYVLCKDVAGMCSSQDGVDESPLLGYLQHGVEIGAKSVFRYLRSRLLQEPRPSAAMLPSWLKTVTQTS